jgi:hypothetical protein
MPLSIASVLIPLGLGGALAILLGPISMGPLHLAPSIGVLMLLFMSSISLLLSPIVTTAVTRVGGGEERVGGDSGRGGVCVEVGG